MNNKLGVGESGSILMGVGITMVKDQLYVGLGLIGFGALLNILVAWLQKKGIEIQSPQG